MSNIIVVTSNTARKCHKEKLDSIDIITEQQRQLVYKLVEEENVSSFRLNSCHQSAKRYYHAMCFMLTDSAFQQLSLYLTGHTNFKFSSHTLKLDLTTSLEIVLLPHLWEALYFHLEKQFLLTNYKPARIDKISCYVKKHFIDNFEISHSINASFLQLSVIDNESNI